MGRQPGQRNPHLLLNSGTADLGKLERPTVAQLYGNDPRGIIVQAGRKSQGYCDAIGEEWQIQQTSISDVLRIQSRKLTSVLTSHKTVTCQAY